MIVFKNNPTRSMRITSMFGNRIDPISGLKKLHHGIDIGANVIGKQGDPLYAVSNGKVIVSKIDGAGLSKGYGRYIVVQHDGFSTLYAHQMELEVKVGNIVIAGQIIGHMGNTGASTATHLHFGLTNGLYSNKKFIDPTPYLITENVIEDDVITKYEAISILKEIVKLEDGTINYLLNYKYGESLIIKLAKSIKGC